MIETTSSIVVFAVGRSATRRPSRMMARRSATPNDIRQAVADEDDRLAPIANPSHEVQDLPRLGHPERRGGFVHDDHALAPGGCPSDSQGLALAARERLDRLAHRAELDAEIDEVRLGRLTHGPMVDHPEQGACRASSTGPSRPRNMFVTTSRAGETARPGRRSRPRPDVHLAEIRTGPNDRPPGSCPRPAR